mmetsp:Transcript_19958/g.61964  ORF Transcript_19958/g.61964 Transcript_19958/m.61964 type:complete len:266 (+) Transcript_19958:4432-5229(+)
MRGAWGQALTERELQVETEMVQQVAQRVSPALVAVPDNATEAAVLRMLLNFSETFAAVDGRFVDQFLPGPDSDDAHGALRATAAFTRAALTGKPLRLAPAAIVRPRPCAKDASTTCVDILLISDGEYARLPQQCATQPSDLRLLRASNECLARGLEGTAAVAVSFGGLRALWRSGRHNCGALARAVLLNADAGMLDEFGCGDEGTEREATAVVEAVLREAVGRPQQPLREYIPPPFQHHDAVANFRGSKIDDVVIGILASLQKES